MIFKVCGRVSEQESNNGVTGLLVKAIDKDIIFDDFLGAVTTGKDGLFEIIFESEDFEEFFDSRPDIYIKIKSPNQKQILFTSEKKVRWNAGKEEYFDIKIPKGVLGNLSPTKEVKKMGYGKLNVWLRYSDCSLITTCWRTDLVVKSCCGDYLTDMDPTVIEQLKGRYPDYQIDVHQYEGETRIKFDPPGREKINHIELDVPPGCYIVWTRVCYGRNEETNKVMVIVDCCGHVCVNLLLDKVKTCSRELIYPLALDVLDMRIPREEIGVAIKVLAQAAEIPMDNVMNDLKRRVKEVEEHPEILKGLNQIIDIMNDKGKDC